MPRRQNRKFANLFFCCLILTALMQTVIAARVRADGCFVWRESIGSWLREPAQKAVIYWDGSREMLLLQVRYEGPAEDFAWIVPLPSEPETTVVDADKSPFAEISLYARRRTGQDLRLRSMGRSAVRSSRTEVDVIDRRIVGVYDIAVLASAHAGSLTGWLNKNGFAFPASRTDVLEHYTKKKWVYAAMRIDRKALGTVETSKLAVGEIQPVRFSFATTEMVYPLRISSVNAGETEILLYVLADVPMAAKDDYGRRRGFSIDENIPYARGWDYSRDPEYGTYMRISGSVLPLTWKALNISEETELFVCEYGAVFGSDEMRDDLVFERFDPVPYYETNGDYELLTTLFRNNRKKYGGIYLNLLRKMADDTSPLERLIVAWNPDTPSDILRRLSHDSDERVREEAMSNLRFRGEDRPAIK
ncbi:DUF2330 domain-containing protein [Desulfobacterales bacterium HSG2]|nr:DUF2330 domain-containing protein [Desulfobacterales bacterium HSG2]